MKVMKDVSLSKTVAFYRWGRASTKVEKCPHIMLVIMDYNYVLEIAHNLLKPDAGPRKA